MFFQIGSVDRFSFNYSRFLRRIRQSLQAAYEKAKKENGVTQGSIAEQLSVDPSVISKRLKCEGNITLKSISDLYVAMGCEPFENFTVEDKYDWDGAAFVQISLFQVNVDEIMAIASEFNFNFVQKQNSSSGPSENIQNVFSDATLERFLKIGEENGVPASI